jgi:hypothetical protein
VGGQKIVTPFPANVTSRSLILRDEPGSDAFEWFVEKQHPWAVQQGHRQRTIVSEWNSTSSSGRIPINRRRATISTETGLTGDAYLPGGRREQPT